MKLERFSEGKLVLKMGARERQLFLDVLKLYPLVPPAHHKITKGNIPHQQSTQHLLDEAIAEQRADNKKQLQILLGDPARVQQQKDGIRLLLTPAEAEWLLQILNDIRVGSWILLGSPEGKLSKINLETARYVWVMEMAGFFEAEFLEALETGDHSRP